MYPVPLATLGELAALEAGAESVGAFGVGECGRCVCRGGDRVRRAMVS
jgi:hypothetical protein